MIEVKWISNILDMYFIYLFIFFAEISCLAHGACIGYSLALTLTDNVGLTNCRYWWKIRMLKMYLLIWKIVNVSC